MITTKAVTHVAARFGKPHHGSADLMSLFFAPLNKIAALP